MTQKLTLPIQVGKKYVRRDWKVITVQEAYYDKARGCVFVGEGEVHPDRTGEEHVWVRDGLVYSPGRPHQNDIVADFVENLESIPKTQPEQKAYKHAEAMMEYAKDAAQSETPWENWEVQNYNTDKWYTLNSHPAWKTLSNYRRKPNKVTINGIECTAGVKEPVFDERYYISYITTPALFLTIRYSGAYRHFTELGLVHKTIEDAIAMSKAMLAFQTCNTK